MIGVDIACDWLGRAMLGIGKRRGNDRLFPLPCICVYESRGRERERELDDMAAAMKSSMTREREGAIIYVYV